MWVFTQEGFFSAVLHKDDPSLMVVRGRDLGDIVTLSKRIGKMTKKKAPKVLTNHGFDYPHRVIVSRGQWDRALAKMNEEIDYSDFKTRVKKKQGSERYSIYTEVWSVMHDLQRPPVGKTVWSKWNDLSRLPPAQPKNMTTTDTDEEWTEWASLNETERDRQLGLQTTPLIQSKVKGARCDHCDREWSEVKKAGHEDYCDDGYPTWEHFFILEKAT